MWLPSPRWSWLKGTQDFYRVRKKRCESFEEFPYVIWLTHPLGSLHFNATNVLPNKIFFLQYLKKMTKL